MATSIYRNYLRLLEAWPVDTSKEGLNLCQHIRNRVAQAFQNGEASSVDENECGKTYRSLHRLATNTYASRYPRQLGSSATGMPREVCRMVMSAEAMHIYRQQNKGVTTRIGEWLMPGRRKGVAPAKS